MKQNYQLLMQKEIEFTKTLPQKPTLLLHACCAPCSSAVLEVLVEHFDITIFFYNPNISPKSEFDYRSDELYRLLDEMNLSQIRIVAPDYDENEFFDIAKGNEHLPEGGARCKDCYRLRLEKTAEYAKKGGFDYFTTTLTISPLKNAERLNEIGNKLADKYGVAYLLSDFKKKNGYKRSIELSKEYGLYRQDYCGCEFSQRDRIKNEERGN